MDDIEDIIGEDELGRSAMDAATRTPMVAPKVATETSEVSTARRNGADNASFVPGTQKIWLKTYGCSHNVSDSEYMQGVLASYGYRFTDTPEDAQLWLLNSCTVKDPSQAAFMHLVLKAKTAGKAVVVAGCVPQADRYLKGLDGVSMVGIQQVDRVVEVVEETLRGHTVRLLAKNRLPELDLPKIRKNAMVEIIPLSTGCLGACTYCKTRHARGHLGSYTIEAIVTRARHVIEEGVTEIWLSSEDTGAYGLDIGTDLPTLLRSLLAVVPEGVMLRVGMTNPPYILAHLDAVADILNHDSVYSFLHVPVQSGSDDVLLAMNREYTVAEFEQVADALLTKVPHMTVATDIICGFPTETEEHFDETMALVAKYLFHIMNISQFYPRPGTPAAKMKRVPTQVVKNRSRRITKLFDSVDPYPYMVDTVQKVWINTELSDDQTYTVGHTKNYTKVLLARDDTLIGCSAQVRITASARFHVLGDVLSRSEPPTPAAAAIRERILHDGRMTPAAMAGAISNKLERAEAGEASSGCCEQDGAGCDSNGSECCGSTGACSSAKLSSVGGTKSSGTSLGTRRTNTLLHQIREDPVALAAAVTAVASAVLVISRLIMIRR